MDRIMEWILTHPLKSWVKPKQATSRWNFSSVLFAISLFFIALVPEFISLYGGGNMNQWAIVFSWISLGLGLLAFLFFLWFLWWCHKNPSEDTVLAEVAEVKTALAEVKSELSKMRNENKANTDNIVNIISELVKEIRADRESRNGK